MSPEPSLLVRALPIVVALALQPIAAYAVARTAAWVAMGEYRALLRQRLDAHRTERARTAWVEVVTDVDTLA